MKYLKIKQTKSLREKVQEKYIFNQQVEGTGKPEGIKEKNRIDQNRFI